MASSVHLEVVRRPVAAGWAKDRMFQVTAMKEIGEICTGAKDVTYPYTISSYACTTQSKLPNTVKPVYNGTRIIT